MTFKIQMALMLQLPTVPSSHPRTRHRFPLHHNYLHKLKKLLFLMTYKLGHSCHLANYVTMIA